MGGQTEAARLRVLIVGAGGQGRIVAEALLAGREAHGCVPVGFIDDRPWPAGDTVLGLPVVGTVARLSEVPHDAVIVAIGDNAQRERVSVALAASGERLVTARHPFSSVAFDVVIGAGSMLSAGAVVTPGVTLGRGVLLNTRASVDHDSVIADYVHVAPGAVVGANVTVGARTLIGSGATVMSGCRVGADSIIGAGAVVTGHLPDKVVAIGVPARARRAVR